MESLNNIHFDVIGEDGETVIIWGHGWGQSHKSFQPMVSALEQLGRHIMVDFPGFGESPVPTETWSTKDYANATAKLIREKTDRPVIWIGHSFGCRVGLQLAAHHPELVKGLVLIAAAGLPRKTPVLKKLYYKSRVSLYKALKKLTPLGLSDEWLLKKFGSTDYRNAGPMRDILVRTVNEDLSDTARKIKCPVTLAYGKQDTETPVEIGERLNKLIPCSELVVFEDMDHYSVLNEGRHQIASLIKKFTETLDT